MDPNLMKAQMFRKMAPASILYALIYTLCIYENISGITMPFWIAATIGYAFYAVSLAGKR